MRKTLYVFIGLLIALVSASPALAGWSDVVSGVKDSLTDSKTTDVRGTEASDSEVIQGLKEALTQAATKSVDALGKEDGFLKNPAVTIPVPSHLTMVAKGLKAAGQESIFLNKHGFSSKGGLLDSISTLFNDNTCRYFIPYGIKDEEQLEMLCDDLLRGGFSFLPGGER